MVPGLDNIDFGCPRPSASSEFEGLLRRLYRKARPALAEARRDLQAAWVPLNDPWMRTVETLLDHPWSRPGTAFQAGFGLGLLCPRRVDLLRFVLPFYVAASRLTRICAHEVLHFYYFDKLSRLDPKVPPREYDAPHRAWALSEAVATVLLHDPRAERVLGPADEVCYAVPPEELLRVQELYGQHRVTGGRFESFYSELVALDLRLAGFSDDPHSTFPPAP